MGVLPAPLGAVTRLARATDELLSLSPELYLPPFLRQAWEHRGPLLARAGARPHVPPVH